MRAHALLRDHPFRAPIAAALRAIEANRGCATSARHPNVYRRRPRLAISVATLLYLCSMFGTALGGASEPGAPRVVSIGGSVTEIVYELGVAERVVAVDSTSRYPADTSGKPNVGYMRALSAEPILAMRPSLVLAEADAGPPTTLAQLREAGVNVVKVTDDPSPAGIIEKARAIATALGTPARGEALAARIEADLEAARDAVARAVRQPRVLFLLSVGSGSPLAGGRGTSAEAIIELAGGVNATPDFEGFKPMSPEAMVAAAPDYLLVTERSLDRMGGESGVLAIPGIGITPAGGARRIIAMDGLLLLGFGPRTPSAIVELAKRLHPGLVW